MVTMKEDLYIGIDPGQLGALAVLDSGGEIREVLLHDKLGYLQILGLLVQKASLHAFVEHLNARPPMQCSAKTNFSLGEDFGWTCGVLESLRIPYQLVRPATWKKEFGCTSDKNTSIQTARRLFPSVDLRRTERCKKDHDGKAEALLIAEWGRRHHG